jgi:hypothetical protein
VKQRSEEWYADRLGALTGSRAGELIGTALKRRRYLVEKAVEVSTGTYRQFDAKALKFGRDNEPKAIVQYEFEYAEKVQEVGLVQLPTNRRIQCSPDGLVRLSKIIEVKSRMQPNEHVDALFHGVPPDKELPQMQWNLWVTNRNVCDYISYCPAMPPKSQLVVIHVSRDDGMIEKMAKAADKFLWDLDELVERLI